MKNFNRLEFSKKLLVFTEALVMFVAVVSAIALFLGISEPLTALITGVFGLASMSFGFYFWKAKCENVKKNAKELDPATIKKILELWEAYRETHEEG